MPRMSKAKELLIKRFNVEKDQVNALSKEEAESMLKEYEEAEHVMDEVISPLFDDESVAKNDDDDSPIMYTPEWTEYVMGLLTEEEKVDGCPKVSGLLRVTQRIFGPISIQSEVVQVPSVDNAGRATVVSNIQFDTSAGLRMVSGAADVYSGNTSHEYARHAVATAESRAEGRALRKLLGLSNIHTAEELTSDTSGSDGVVDNKIPTGMLTGIMSMCHSQKIDLFKTLAYLKMDVKETKDLTIHQGRQIAQTIREWTTTNIPEEVRA